MIPAIATMASQVVKCISYFNDYPPRMLNNANGALFCKYAYESRKRAQ